MRNNAQEGGVKMFFERHSVSMIVTVRLEPVKFQVSYAAILNLTLSSRCASSSWRLFLPQGDWDSVAPPGHATGVPLGGQVSR